MNTAIQPTSSLGSSLLGLHSLQPKNVKAHTQIAFRGNGEGTDLFSHAQTLAHHAPKIFEKFNSHFRILNETSDTLSSLSMIWNGLSFAYKGFFRGRKLLKLFSEGKKGDKAKQKESTLEPKLDDLLTQGKASQALLIENFKNVNQALSGLQKQIQAMGDAKVLAANDHITSAKEALENAHQQRDPQAKQLQFSLFQQQLVHAQHHLGLAKSTATSKEGRIQAALTYGECALMLGQPKSAINQIDQAIMMMDGVPDVNMYYSLGQIAEQKGETKQASFFYNLGLFKANLEDDSQHNGAHLASAQGYRLMARNQQQLEELPVAEELARCAVDIEETHLGSYDHTLVKSYTQLGDILSAEGKVNEALPYLEKALTIQKISADDHAPETKALVKKVSNALRSTGQHEAAQSIF
jgi:tetratricopeptide (TPR) repeat protein